MTNSFIFEILKNPFSAPSLIIILFVFQIFAITKISSETFKIFAENLKQVSEKEKRTKLCILIISGLIFLSSIFFHFYKMTEVPPAGHEDDAKVVILGYLLKNSAMDSTEKILPYFPDLKVFYHKEHVGGEGQRPFPIYMQAFVQYLTPASHLSFRMGTTIITLLSAIMVVFTTLLITKDLTTSLLCGTLFIFIPWTRTFSRISTESAAYCFGAASYLFSIFYLAKNRSLFGIFFYLISLAILFLSYTAGIMLAPLCAILIPFVFLLQGKENKGLCIKLLIASSVLLGLLYLGSHDDGGFKSSIARAQHAQGITGIDTLNLSELKNTFLKNANIYSANFLGYLLPHYLFLSGDGNLRHNTGFGGQFFITLVFAFYIGLIYAINRFKNDLNFKLLISYLLISIMPACICLEGAYDRYLKLPLHAIRSGSMFPAACILVFLGLITIFKKSKVLFSIYILAIMFNAYLFYMDYFIEYPKRLGNSWICDSGLPKATQKAMEIIKKHPNKKLFYECSVFSIAYNNLDTIGVANLQKGDGLLSNVYHYDPNQAIKPEKGDLVVVQEPFNYGSLNKPFKFILRVRNKHLENNNYGASLFKIIE